MKIQKMFLAFVLIILVVSTASAAPKPPNPGDHPPSPQEGYSIDISSVHYRDVNAGNSNPVTADVYVRKGPSYPLCGLDKNNFKLTTVTMPPNGYPVTLNSIGTISPPGDCGYVLFISPAPYNWVAGEYAVKVYYMNNYKEFIIKIT